MKKFLIILSVLVTVNATAQISSSIGIPMFVKQTGITFINSASAQFVSHTSGCTTSAINTVGVNLIVISASFYNNAAATLTDNQGNTWTALNINAAGNYRNRLYYCLNPTTSASHTFFYTQGSAYAAIHVLTFSGVTAYEQQTSSTGSSPATSASLTPSNNGSLILSGLASDYATTGSIASPFTGYFTGYVTSQRIVAGFGYYIQPTAASINSTWTWGSGTSGVISLAVFY